MKRADISFALFVLLMMVSCSNGALYGINSKLDRIADAAEKIARAR